MISVIAKYLPAVALAAGAGMTALVGTPRPTPLRQPLATTLPANFLGVPAIDVPISTSEVDGSGVSDYLNRMYNLSKDEPVGLYIGYHATQQGDKYMHSPAVCLPGSGWTPVSDQVIPVTIGARHATVNRYVLQNNGKKILVYYWFQGRGRMTAGTGELKLNTIKDGFLTHRDEEALVRIVLPLDPKQQSMGNTGLPPDSVAVRLVSAVVPSLDRALPPAP